MRKSWGKDDGSREKTASLLPSSEREPEKGDGEFKLTTIHNGWAQGEPRMMKGREREREMEKVDAEAEAVSEPGTGREEMSEKPIIIINLGGDGLAAG